jgi:mobilome CxxCx(11)CxxC protein
MVDSTTIEIRRIRFDALAAMHLHRHFIHVLRRRLVWIELASLVVPLLVIGTMLCLMLAPGAAEMATVVQWIGAANCVLSIALAGLVSWSWVGSFRERLKAHEEALARNTKVRAECDRLLRLEAVGREELEELVALDSEATGHDMSLLPEFGDGVRAMAYRAVLREENSVCPRCRADPWVKSWHITGQSCAMCGARVNKEARNGPSGTAQDVVREARVLPEEGGDGVPVRGPALAGGDVRGPATDGPEGPVHWGQT